MGKKGKDARPFKIGLPVPRELWERFVAIAEGMTPRVSKTALLEHVLREFVDKHERGEI